MRAICIHGHFYQPPRENPWLESIELQEGAHPYHDWNERVTAECYAPNGAARILDSRGRIEKIVNNYARISFNFGPTLLTWMQERAPETYQAVLDGDRASIARFNGHGSAIAQAYNHMIMPLANRRDKQTQVRWGVRDFEKRFGRRPEGMWLPETAVDLETLDLLSDEGIRFTILAPNQAKRIRSGHGDWHNVGERIDTTRPYFCRLPSGRAIALFFYDSPTSRGVAFEGLLNNGERFAQRLLSNSEGPIPRLVNIATDGESYGHHHRYGDMALASALDVLDAHPEVRLTNYAQFLSMYPPLDEVEIVEYSSWSCAHGIERWRSDCGCRTGGEAGWNQSWRGPLRDALDWLRDHLAPLFEREGLRLLRDPWAARDAYINVVLDRSDDSVQRFVADYALNAHTGTDLVQMLQLLEMQRQAMLMYTSCGWFFNEVSGIETVQVLQYAARAIQLAKETSGTDLEENFLTRLSLAKSNHVAVDNAGALYETEVKASMLDLTRVAAHYAVSSLFHEYPSSARIYCYEVDRDDQVVFEAGRPHVIVGRVHVQSMITRATRLFSWGALHLGDLNLSGGVREFIDETAYQALIDALAAPFHNGDFSGVIRILDREFGTLTFSVKSLFSDEQRRILEASWSSSLADADPLSKELYERYVPLMRFHAELGIPLPRILRVAVEFAFNMHLRRLLDKENPPIAQLRSILQEVRTEKIELDQATLSFSLQRELAAAVEELGEDPRSIASVRRLDHVLEIASLLPFGIDLWKAQNVFFHLLQVVMPEFTDRTGNGDEQARIWLRHFRSIGNRLSVRDS